MPGLLPEGRKVALQDDFGGRAPVGCPLRGNRRVSGWLPEAAVCFGGPPLSSRACGSTAMYRAATTLCVCEETLWPNREGAVLLIPMVSGLIPRGVKHTPHRMPEYSVVLAEEGGLCSARSEFKP